MGGKKANAQSCNIDFQTNFKGEGGRQFVETAAAAEDNKG
jgi:hypothetical protein